MDDFENIKRIIYMWRRYEGWRCNFKIGGTKIDKCYTFSNLDELDRRIALYFQHKDKFNWNKGEVVFEEDEDE